MPIFNLTKLSCYVPCKSTVSLARCCSMASSSSSLLPPPHNTRVLLQRPFLGAQVWPALDWSAHSALPSTEPLSVQQHHRWVHL